MGSDRIARWKWILGIAAAALLILFVVLPLFVAWSLLHPPRNQTALSPRDAGLPFEEVALRSADGLRLSGWFIPGNRTDAAIVLLHGYQGSKASMLPQAGFLHRGATPSSCRTSGTAGGRRARSQPSASGSGGTRWLRPTNSRPATSAASESRGSPWVRRRPSTLPPTTPGSPPR